MVDLTKSEKMRKIGRTVDKPDIDNGLIYDIRLQIDGLF